MLHRGRRVSPPHQPRIADNRAVNTQQQPFIIDVDRGTITCRTCGRTSHAPEDVRNRYCGHCNVFHPDPVCEWCDEPIERDEPINPSTMNGKNTHLECSFRAIVGGANHIRGLCSCCGGTESPDPEGLTRREAAKASWEAYREREAQDH